MTRNVIVTCDGCGAQADSEWANKNWLKFHCEGSYGSIIQRGLEIMGGLNDYDFCSMHCITLAMQADYEEVRKANPGVLDGPTKAK